MTSPIAKRHSISEMFSTVLNPNQLRLLFCTSISTSDGNFQSSPSIYPVCHPFPGPHTVEDQERKQMSTDRKKLSVTIL